MSWIKKIFHSDEGPPDKLVKPPFPPLVRDVFGSDKNLFEWRGEVRLQSWTGFAKPEDLTCDGWAPDNPRPDGILTLSIEPADVEPGSEPAEDQARAFQHLLDICSTKPCLAAWQPLGLACCSTWGAALCFGVAQAARWRLLFAPPG
jgi:hypothetical protein